MYHIAFGFAWFKQLIIFKNQILCQATLESLIALKLILKLAGYDPIVFKNIYNVVKEKIKVVRNGMKLYYQSFKLMKYLIVLSGIFI